MFGPVAYRAVAVLTERRARYHAEHDVELATLEYLDWYNHRRLHTACSDIPPAEYEACRRRANVGSGTHSAVGSIG